MNSDWWMPRGASLQSSAHFSWPMLLVHLSDSPPNPANNGNIAKSVTRQCLLAITQSSQGCPVFSLYNLATDFHKLGPIGRFVSEITAVVDTVGKPLEIPNLGQ